VSIKARRPLPRVSCCTYRVAAPAGKGIRGERIFDWLDQHIPA
jgi:hypothetical protein